MKHSTSQGHRPLIEPLEGRTLLSASAPAMAGLQPLDATPALMQPAATVATATNVTVSASTVPLGTPFTLTATVSQSNRRARGAPTGSINFMYYVGRRAKLLQNVTLNRRGSATVSWSPGDAIFVGNFAFSAVYVPTGSFAASNGNTQAVSITVPRLRTARDGLQTATIVAGSGTPVSSGGTVTVDYTGFLTDGTVFDSSSSHGGPQQFSLSGVVPGFAEGLTGMEPGEIRVLVIPPALGYGSGGTTGVPGNSTLVFIVRLVSSP